MVIERQKVQEQDKELRRHNFEPVENNLTEAHNNRSICPP
jgi:hypothetical protein